MKASLSKRKHRIVEDITSFLTKKRRDKYRNCFIRLLCKGLNRGKSNQKVCLTYFTTILYDSDTLDTLVMCIVCMPNGELEPVYGADVLAAGKNLDKTRFKFSETPKFKLLTENDYRIKVIIFKEDMHEDYKKKLKFFEYLYSKQSINES